MTKKIVLDVGAGDNPNPSATHAIDKMTKPQIENWLQRGADTPAEKAKKKAKIKKLKKYFYGYNLEKKGNIPKELAGKVDVIVSRESIGTASGGPGMGKNIDALTHPGSEVRIITTAPASKYGVAKMEYLVGTALQLKTPDAFKITSVKRQVQRDKGHKAPVSYRFQIKARKPKGIRTGRIVDGKGRSHTQKQGSVI